MSSRIAYTVTATLPDERTAREYIAWLQDGHLDAVIAGGAHSAMIVRLEPPDRPGGAKGSGGVVGGGGGGDGPVQVETRYVFSTRETFDRYVAEVAPALRADGLRRFPPDRGVTFERRLGVIL